MLAVMVSLLSQGLALLGTRSFSHGVKLETSTNTLHLLEEQVFP
jgi:hypothetical protein